ncbi:MAG: UvrB/UvrC motif-containing protein [bacterium]|nr:UvrB/UvrC motif-containing protein [bacterium]MDZ4285483.1 UvrB/UvrC motif-containing protein [Candidatus Sungbacteria bacterium]
MSNQIKIAEYTPSLIPTDPGVYVFRRGSAALYIGKASNLRKRVSSYFRANVSEKVRQLRSEATTLELISLQSEIEALIREAELIKRFVPKFNVLMRDDKNYAFVAITDETFPKIFVTHQPGHGASKPRNINQAQTTFVGPFTSGTSLKITLKLLQRLFPYCTCFTAHTRRCLNAQLGLCPGYCCLKQNPPELIESFKKEYKNPINAIIGILTGKRQHITKDLKKRMKAAIAAQHFELAATLRDQMQGIEDVISHRMHLTETGTKKKNYTSNWRHSEKNIIMALGIEKPISRVEGYDISHVSGASTTASMVVFIDGAPSRDDYRMFKIKTVHGISDVDALKEVIHRRLAHPEWQFPDLMVIDGGKPQLNAVMSVIIKEAPQLARRVVSLAKREEELYSPYKTHTVRLDSLPADTGFFFQRIRDESHRFAKRYHHKLREISYRPKD